jgi:hypothetical protein
MGVPSISGWDLIVIAIIIGLIGWGSIELTLHLIKWIGSHLQWV